MDSPPLHRLRVKRVFPPVRVPQFVKGRRLDHSRESQRPCGRVDVQTSGAQNGHGLPGNRAEMVIVDAEPVSVTQGVCERCKVVVGREDAVAGCEVAAGDVFAALPFAVAMEWHHKHVLPTSFTDRLGCPRNTRSVERRAHSG